MNLFYKTKLYLQHKKGNFSQFQYSIQNKKIWRNQKCTDQSISLIDRFKLN